MTEEPVPVTAPRTVSPYNPANILTVLRIVLVPVFLALVVSSQLTGTGARIVTCLVFCVASATDFVDGWIARRWSLVTSFGKVADPIADKALTGTALVLLSVYDRLPWWVTVLILVREWGITALRFWVIRYGIIPASRGGKLKTVLQIAAIAWYLWPVPTPFDIVGPWLMGAATLVTVVTGVDYVVEALRLRRDARRGTGSGA
ncbi:CDP-diacylglycerol--glycerol-3-phosphate 3-phosphatidyltransferase [Paractinoplanes lichenicola]|uniref:CDP-diacylglycerol--glycerol-3-phosphate 3-phosphatidyltransferase n=1 Tax=Paractinoplanes lichenicola TaxID=2802976 RepID=A0ABS1VG10_9ACTN|nr:CDP-diacylglycerol--glycerol-3-phosphate 3-phosphatidyltransferase [Actinoplanes lichenicola]MBL7253637.1 CDP-diacylglycerol--glycerol-3-phosphate 3-phosphatidyltransferase [Actinoplanes lichenicola]